VSQSSGFAFQISSAQPSFIYKDTTIQLLFPYISGQVKSLFLDGWDKLEIPYIQDGYLLSIGFSTLQELCKSVQSLIDQNLTQYQTEFNQNSQETSSTISSSLTIYKKLNSLSDTNFQKSSHINECLHLMNSCSNNFLFVYNILLESSLDESITDQIIKSIRTLIYICSVLNLNLQRDAFVTLLCKAALPSSYAHSVLNLKSLTDLSYLMQQTNLKNQEFQNPPIFNSKLNPNKTYTSYDDSSEKQIQVVAIGPALISNSSSNSQQSTLCITAKNLLTMKSILNMSHLYAELLGSSWYIVLNTLQHLTWTLGLKPTTGSNGQLKHLANNSGQSTGQGASSASSVTNSNSAVSLASSSDQNSSSTSVSNSSMITTAIQTEIAFICNMLTKLFESSKLVSDQALNDVIDALLKLSIESSDLAYHRQEPCLFPLAKLYETSISNLNRIDLFWEKVTMHLLLSCKHTNLKYREWCVDFICNMIRSTFNFKFTNTSKKEDTSSNHELTSSDKILKPLYELSSISYNDIRQKQIECTLTILRLMGQNLNESWPLCLNIIGAIQKEHTDILIRSSFQCLQLVVTDFLSMIRAKYLSQVINVVAKFGSQEQDLNISLTAVVLLWNISDYMFQNSEKLSQELLKNQPQEVDKDQQSIESIWMVLYSRLGQLCVDPRPAVRKSACQTLFCTISSHGSILSVDQHWKELVWNVLFPLLEQVKHFTSTASRERDKHPNNPNFLMHHSRDTAEKQWAETSVLTLSGVTRVFNSKYSVLIKLSQEEFHKMWLFLLNIIQSFGLSRNSEIAQSALRGFHELLGNQNYFSSASSFISSSNTAAQTVAAAAASASAVTNVNNNQNQAVQNGLNNSNCANNNINNLVNQNVKNFDISEWLTAWKIWLDIGNSLLNQPTNSNPAISDLLSIYSLPPPGQTYLTCYIDLVSVIVDRLAPAGKFTQKDFENFSQILDKLLSVPVLSSDYSSFILMQTESNLTPLQNSCLSTIKNFIKVIKNYLI
jgi:hypothetical protein